jgi:hypothetical protein
MNLGRQDADKGKPDLQNLKLPLSCQGEEFQKLSVG